MRFAKTSVGLTDRRRWQRLPVTMHADTRERAEAFASLIPPGSSVLDLGSGPQFLRSLIPADCEYQPCDLADGPDVLFCDLNSGIYPPISHRYDIVVCAGVLEYLNDLEAFLRALPGLGTRFLVSYVALDAPEEPSGRTARVRRIADGFMNHLSYAELEQTFSELGFRWELFGTWPGAGQGYSLVLDAESERAAQARS